MLAFLTFLWLITESCRKLILQQVGSGSELG